MPRWNVFSQCWILQRFFLDSVVNYALQPHLTHLCKACTPLASGTAARYFQYFHCGGRVVRTSEKEKRKKKVNKRSMIRVWRWKRAGWRWWTELIRNTKSRKKLVPQVRGGIPDWAVCDLETGVNWWLKKSDQCRWLIGLRRLDCDEIMQVMWRRLEELMWWK